VTLGLSFHPGSHGNQSLDVENFIKPTLDAVAAGLFSANSVSLETLSRWHHDDSNFNHLLIHRLGDARDSSSEGGALFVCCS
jgi:hypothetical protein